MKEFIVRYWLEVLFGASLTVLGGGFAYLRSRIGRLHQIERGILALLHDRMYGECSRLLWLGTASAEDKHNLEYLYTPYKLLGGNGTAEAMYKQCLQLPLPRKERDK